MDDSPLKIGFIIPYFYPAWQYGGQPRSAFDLARGLIRRGHRVKVLITDSGGNARLGDEIVGNDLRQSVEGIEVLYYRNVSNRLAYRQRLFLPQGLMSSIRSEFHDWDIIHI